MLGLGLGVTETLTLENRMGLAEKSCFTAANRLPDRFARPGFAIRLATNKRHLRVMVMSPDSGLAVLIGFCFSQVRKYIRLANLLEHLFFQLCMCAFV